MKKLILILALAMPMLVSAQKYAHINTQDLFAQMPELKDVQDRLDSLNKQYETLLMTMRDEFQKKYQEYQQKQNTMTDAIRQIQEEELASMNQRLQTTYETAQQDVQKKQQEWIAPIHERMAKAIQSVGAAKGFTYVFDSAMLLHIGNDATDIMADVKKELGIK